MCSPPTVACCARTERTIPIDQRTPLPAHGDVHIDDLAILFVFAFSDVHVDSSPIEVQRSDALYDFAHMRTNVGKSGITLSAEFWRGRLDGVSGTLGFSVERRVSLMIITMLVAAVGVNRTLLQRLLGGLGIRPCLSARSVPHCSHHLASKRALLDEIVLVTGLGPFLETNLRAEPLRKASRYGVSEWRWRLRRVHHTAGLARLVRLDRGEKENTRALIGKARNSVRDAQPLRHHVVSFRFFRRQAHQSLGTREPDGLHEKEYVEGSCWH